MSAKTASAGKYRWSKFFWRDWQNDIGLRTCSLAARGLWIEMLAIMHEAEPHGHLSISGKQASIKQIAGLTNSTAADVTKLLAELREAGVFSVTDTGIIYSRRMVRDREMSEQGREFGVRRKTATNDDDQGGGTNQGEPSDGAIPSTPIAAMGCTPVDDLGCRGGVHPPPTPELNLGGEAQSTERKKVRAESKNSPSESRSQVAVSAREMLWGDGRQLLREVVGFGDSQARALLGKLLRDVGDDCAALLAIIREAESLRPIDPVAWISKAAKHRGQPAAGPPKRETTRARLTRELGLDPSLDDAFRSSTRVLQ